MQIGVERAFLGPTCSTSLDRLETGRTQEQAYTFPNHEQPPPEIALSRSWPIFFIPNNFGLAMASSPANLLLPSRLFLKCQKLGPGNSCCLLLCLIEDSFVYVVSVNYRPSTNSKVVSIFRIQFSRTQNRCMSFSMLGDELTEMYFSFVKVTLLLRGRVCKLAISVSAALRFSVVSVDVILVFSILNHLWAWYCLADGGCLFLDQGIINFIYGHTFIQQVHLWL